MQLHEIQHEEQLISTIDVDSYVFQHNTRSNHESIEDESEVMHEMYVNAITFSDGEHPIPVDHISHVIVES